MKYLDTGIVIGSILEKELAHKDCLRIMQALENKKEHVLFSASNISEVFYILKRENFTLTRIREVLEDLRKISGIQFADVSIDQTMQAIRLSEKYKVDLTDALNYILMKQFQIKYIYAIDSHFDKFSDIQRLTQLKI